MTVSSREYAVALFELAKETASEEEIYNAFGFVSEVFELCPGIIDFLNSPAIPVTERTGVLNTTFSDSVPEYFLSFLGILCENRNIRIFHECRVEYEYLYTESVRLTLAVVRSAVRLTDEEKKKLSKKLEKISGHKVRMEYEIDETLLGGIVVEMDGVCYDGSLKHRLQNIKEVISK